MEEKVNWMKLAITAKEAKATSSVDPRFGRAKCFAIVDSESEEIEFLQNDESQKATQGAGPLAAQLVVEHGARAVLTGHCGPKAFRALQAAGVEIYTGVDSTIEQALKDFRAGNLKACERPDVSGHWA